MLTVKEKYYKRLSRTRKSLKTNNKSGRIRLSVFRSNMNIYAQLVDDSKGVTLASASTLDKELVKDIKKSSTIEAAKQVGTIIAKKAKSLKISKVVFDKGAYKYHGRIKALADAARETNILEF
jgi:large subunit ribosomal protein L18